ncbi:ParB/Srx family N-terminal domain-containing protein [Alteromonas sp. ASW11-130]|uniref:ParB/Srx family N-terminal domain-containing protein n=1 Tax=Alteromonas sp. ASW11-130 TaxID=3015775 RepID=UPI002241F88B|nr:ParB/Srx family N-terminal domain-containing protein [Alteromonas sp. ASW11-130]MCW8092935.1 ParB/Srx family N-terminal domain-containing protein [Alteromonas sp. ASW11-130]
MNTVSLAQNLAAALNAVDADRLLIEQPYDYKSVFISRVHPDTTNPRFFPAVMMSDLHALQMLERKLTKQQLITRYDAKDKVVIGKGCIVNCFEYGTNEWKKANQSIESITELAANVAVSEIIQVPTIYPLESGDYQILTGHRRFFALVFANGINSAAHFKVYDKCPVLPKTKQFQENASREDLPQYGKLQAFEDALLEIETLNNTRKRMGNKALTVRQTASTLGISMGAFDNYNVLTRYPAVVKAYADGCSTPFIQMKKLILKIESDYKLEFDKNILNAIDKKNINERITKHLNGETTNNTPPKKKSSYFQVKIKSVSALKTLLTSNVTELETGICWDELDWDDHKAVEETFNKIVEFLNKV